MIFFIIILVFCDIVNLMEDYIFIEDRKDVVSKFLVHFIMSILIFGVTVIFSYVTFIQFSNNNFQGQLITAFMVILIWGLFYYFLILTIWLFKKSITPDKIIVSSKGIYVSYLNQFISWDIISTIKLVRVNTGRHGCSRPVVAAYLLNKNEILKNIPFYITQNISLKGNGIILYLTHIHYNEKKCNEMISIINRYRNEYGINTEREQPKLSIVDYYEKNKPSYAEIVSKNNILRMTANWDTQTKESVLKEDFKPPILLQEKSTLNRLLIPLLIKSVEKFISILRVKNCWNDLNVRVITDLENIYFDEEKISIVDIDNAQSTEFFAGLYLNRFQTSTRVYHFIGLNTGYICSKFEKF